MYAARYIAVYTLEKKKKCYKSYIGVKYWFLILAAEELKFLYFNYRSRGRKNQLPSPPSLETPFAAMSLALPRNPLS